MSTHVLFDKPWFFPDTIKFLNEYVPDVRYWDIAFLLA
jgi:hypothetical protein